MQLKDFGGLVIDVLMLNVLVFALGMLPPIFGLALTNAKDFISLGSFFFLSGCATTMILYVRNRLPIFYMSAGILAPSLAILVFLILMRLTYEVSISQVANYPNPLEYLRTVTALLFFNMPINVSLHLLRERIHPRSRVIYFAALLVYPMLLSIAVDFQMPLLARFSVG